MVSRKINTGMPLMGLGILGYVHEFVISNNAEFMPIIIFALVFIKGVAILLDKTG